MMRKKIRAKNKAASRKRYPLLFLALMGTASLPSYSQATESYPVNFSVTNASLPEIFNKLEATTGYSFAYTDEVAKLNKSFSVAKTKSIDEVLKKLSEEGNLKFRKDNKTISIAVDEAGKKEKQQISTVSGQVKDNTGQPLPGVSVTIKGTSKGAVTDVDGNYSVNVSGLDQPVLIFSYIGFASQEVVVNNQSQLDIVLGEDTKSLSEVVVIGYGTAKRSDITTAITTLPNADKIANRPISNVADALQGNLAGVTVTQSGGDPSAAPQIVIRGAGTINSESPLWVVDGMPYYGGPLNPRDIETYTVLKDASAAAIYGAQASSGVILVTTKSGKAGKPRVSLDTYYGWQSAHKLPEALNAAEQSAVYNQAADNAGASRPDAHNPDKNPWGQVTRTNWIDEIFRTGGIYNINASISGGNDKGRYLSSFGYQNKDGVLLNTNLKRYNFRIKSDYDFSDKVRVGQNLYVNQSNSQGTNTSNSYSGTIINAIYMPPAAPVYDEEGNFHGVVPDNLVSSFGGSYGDTYNPVALLLRPTVNSPSLNINGTAYVEYSPLANLKFRSGFSMDLLRDSYKRFDPRIPEPGKPNSMNYLTQSEASRNKWIWDNQLSYQKAIGKSFFDVTAVYSAQHTNYEYNWQRGQNFDREDDWFQYMGNAKEIIERPTSSVYEDALTSAIGRISYNYDDRYFLTGSMRRDESSRLHADNNSDIFPAASAAWKISSEPFFRTDFFQMLKLRASWGQIGNIQSVDYYAYNVPLEAGNAYLGASPAFQQAYYINKESNPRLEWERSETFDVGLDVAMFNDRLTLTADYYEKYTRGLILPVDPNRHVGVQNGATRNVGTVLNKGLELALGYSGNIGELTYQVNGNITTLKNELQDLNGYGNDHIVHNQNVRSMFSPYRSTPGQPLFSYYLIPHDGIFQSNEQVAEYTNAQGELIQPNAKAGDLIFRDVNGDGKIDDNDRVYMGNAMPDVAYGLNLNLQWKNFDLTLFGQGVSGVKLLTGYKYSTYNAGLQGYNLDRAVLDAWTPQNTGASIPRLSTSDTNLNFGTASDWYLEKGDYFRIKNLMIGYTLPAQLMSRIRSGASLRVYAAAENLLTITPYEGLDPEIGGVGLDMGTYPVPRTYTVGLNLHF
ncbi:SusC/RagA family TonB-linked outer membrane protein [Pontibacter korlensis]|uniref:SusC/RagA family TonB-linked outer membrane protein n=1 Tax=Pontibacter korlensis TaxID=400092 RepID=UPI000ACEC52E|nr:SusC/RagA family TonB-linked outer membrane protein [Pontibacter korlensis]